MLTLTSGIYTSNVQPADIKEEIIPAQTDVEAMDKSLQRNRIGTKYMATCKFSDLSPIDYQAILAVVNNAATVSYTNTLSNYTGNPGTLTFTALATFSEDSYEPGASLWRNITVVLRQV